MGNWEARWPKPVLRAALGYTQQLKIDIDKKTFMKLHYWLGYKLVGSCRKLNANQRSFFYYDVVYKVCFGQKGPTAP